MWKIKRFPGAQEQSLMGAVELIATTKDKKAWSRAPISLSFQVRGWQHPAFSCRAAWQTLHPRSCRCLSRRFIFN